MADTEQNSDVNWQTVSTYIGAAFLLIGGLFVGWGSWIHGQRIKLGPTWPTVRGTIYQSRLTVCNRSAASAPQVRYSYDVGGKSYDGEVEFKTSHCGSESAAAAVVDAYPQTFTFDVHVNPEDPSESLVLGP